MFVFLVVLQTGDKGTIDVIDTLHVFEDTSVAVMYNSTLKQFEFTNNCDWSITYYSDRPEVITITTTVQGATGLCFPSEE